MTSSQVNINASPRSIPIQRPAHSGTDDRFPIVFVVKARQSRSESCKTCSSRRFVFISKHMTCAVWEALPGDFKVTWMAEYGFVLHPDWNSGDRGSMVQGSNGWQSV